MEIQMLNILKKFGHMFTIHSKEARNAVGLINLMEKSFKMLIKK